MRSLFCRVLLLALFGFSIPAVTLFVQGVWSALVVANFKVSPAIPWAVGPMALVLWLGWQYAGGRWWPGSTAAARRGYLRAIRIPGRTFGWALIAGALAIIALVGYWILIFQLVKLPGNSLPDFSNYPPVTVVLALLMAAVVGAVVEEAGFRGYLQTALERELPAPLAIVFAALLLSPGHGLTQGFVWPTLLWYFGADVMFGITAYLTNSILPGIVIHGLGLLVFFGLVWPADSSRRLVVEDGADAWFWIHAGQAVVFTVLAILAFRQLAKITAGSRANHAAGGGLQPTGPDRSL
jgi:membrane protease YdiL (CAAX protease family)